MTWQIISVELKAKPAHIEQCDKFKLGKHIKKSSVIQRMYASLLSSTVYFIY